MKIYDAEMQYLIVAYPNDVGLDKNNCVVAFNNDRISRNDAGLSLLLVYSLVAPCYGCIARKLVDARSPISISQFLAEAWSTGRGLGMPLSLEVKPGILAAELGFVEWVRTLGIKCSQAVSMHGINGYERSSRNLAFAIEWGLPDRYNKGNNNPIELNIANDCVRSYDIFSSVMHGVRKSMEQSTFDAWNTRSRTFFSGNTILTDWDFGCLIERKKLRPKEHLIVHPSEEPPVFVEGLKEVVAMWPGGKSNFLKGLNISVRDFEFWVSKKAHLPHNGFMALVAKANIHHENQYDEWLLFGGGLLIANTKSNVISAYNELSRGGDLQIACEVLGPSGLTLPFRVLLFKPWGGELTIMLFQRNTAVGALLDKSILINLGSVVYAPHDVWKTIVTIVNCRDRIETPENVAASFASKHADWLDENSSQF